MAGMRTVMMGGQKRPEKPAGNALKQGYRDQEDLVLESDAGEWANCVHTCVEKQQAVAWGATGPCTHASAQQEGFVPTMTLFLLLPTAQ
eukprot:1160836-Pelagomonas_calceolata.AAC.10